MSGILGLAFDAFDLIVQAVFWTIPIGLGILIAWGLERRAERERLARWRRALDAECGSLLGQLPQFIERFRRLRAAIEADAPEPANAARALRTVYDRAVVELAGSLTAKERNALHIVHERLRVGDAVLARWDAEWRAAGRTPLARDTRDAYARRFTEQMESYVLVREIVESFLRGKPIDVLLVDMAEDVRGHVVYEPAPAGETALPT